jgi:hypothetical protein
LRERRIALSSCVMAVCEPVRLSMESGNGEARKNGDASQSSHIG